MVIVSKETVLTQGGVRPSFFLSRLELSSRNKCFHFPKTHANKLE